jgi:hypothetical protein
MLATFALPAAMQAQDDDSATAVQFDSHTFELLRTLADGVSAFVVDAPTDSLDGGDSLQPPRTEFRLQIYTDTIPAPAAVGWINVYDASDLENFPAHEQYERLLQLLREHPNLNDEQSLPTLYPYQRSALPPDRYTEFFTNASYFDSEGYRGITFIYARVIPAGSDREPIMFYRVYFEGISLDEQRYLSAQVEGQQELIEPLDKITDVDEYIAQAKTLFNTSADNDISAWMQDARSLFSSFGYAAP